MQTMTRTEVLRIRVSPAEKLALDRIAEYERRNSSSETLRELIRSTAKAYGLWPAALPENYRQEVVT